MQNFEVNLILENGSTINFTIRNAAAPQGYIASLLTQQIQQPDDFVATDQVSFSVYFKNQVKVIGYTISNAG